MATGGAARSRDVSPAASLEAAGERELEEEDEDEEAAAARRARSFARDARVRFLGGRLQQLLGLPEEKWAQYLQSEERRQVLGEFLESRGRLVFSVAADKGLEAAREVRREAAGGTRATPVRAREGAHTRGETSPELGLGLAGKVSPWRGANPHARPPSRARGLAAL